MRRSLLLTIIAVAAVAATATALYASKTGNAVYLQLQGLPRKSLVAVFVEAVTPDGPRPVHVGMYYLPNGNEAIPIPLEPLHRIALEWKRTRPGLAEYGLIIHAIVFAPTGRNRGYSEYMHILDAASLPLSDMLAGKPLLLEAHVKRLTGTATKLSKIAARQLDRFEMARMAVAQNVGRTVLPTGDVPEPPLGPGGEPPREPYCTTVFGWKPLPHTARVCWYPRLYITPEAIADAAAPSLGEPPFYSGHPLKAISVNRRLYVETPVLIVNNHSGETLDADVGAKFGYTRYALYATLTISPGDFIKYVKKTPLAKLIPSLTVWRSSGPVWGSTTQTYFNIPAHTPPYSAVTVYVFGRPYFVVYNVSYTIGFVTFWSGEAYVVVSDLLTKKVSENLVKVAADYDYGVPEKLAAILRKATCQEYIKTLIPHDPFDSTLTLEEIYGRDSGACSSRLGVNIPAGSAAAIAVCAAVGWELTAPSCTALQTVLGMLSAPFRYKDATSTMLFAVHDAGSKPVDVLASMSRVTYRLDDGVTCRPPLGVMIDAYDSG